MPIESRRFDELNDQFQTDEVTLPGQYVCDLLQDYGSIIESRAVEQTASAFLTNLVLYDEASDGVVFQAQGLNAQLLNCDPNMAQLDELFENPNQLALGYDLLGLIKSRNAIDVAAANQILGMMRSDDGAIRYNAAHLSEMLLDPAQRESAIALAGSFSERQIAEFFAFSVSDRQAANRLLDVIADEAQRALLRGKGDPAPMAIDRTDSTQLLQMLTSGGAQRERALTLLHNCNPQQIQTFLQISRENAHVADALARQLTSASEVERNRAAIVLSMRSGRDAAHLFELMNANSIEYGNAAVAIRQFMDSVRPGSPEVRNLAGVMAGHINRFERNGIQPDQGLVEMLNDPEQQEQAFRILRSASTPEMASDLVVLSNMPAMRPAANQAVRMFNSEIPERVTAAENWLGAINYMNSLNMRQEIARMNRMFSDSQTRGQASSLFRNLGSAPAIAEVFSLMVHRPNDPGLTSIVTLINSGDPNQVRGARNLLLVGAQDRQRERNQPGAQPVPRRFGLILDTFGRESGPSVIQYLRRGPSYEDVDLCFSLIDR